MVLRIAVVSRDGVSVNERFHRATDFFVFERRDAGENGREGAIEFVERRPVAGGTKGRVFRDYSSLVTLLSRCRFIVALGFNGEARKELAARGFRLHEARGTIEDVIRTLPLDRLDAS